MARVTVEDCLSSVDNRFELVMVASKRARQIANGRAPLVQEESDKPTVVALREIAEGLITPDMLSREDEIEAQEELAEVMGAGINPGLGLGGGVSEDISADHRFPSHDAALLSR